jgi:hypothetical protein
MKPINKLKDQISNLAYIFFVYEIKYKISLVNNVWHIH